MIGYPTHKDEVAMVRAHNATTPKSSSVINVTELLALQALARRIHLDDDLYEYSVSLTSFTRSHPRIVLGASPRATLGLIQAAKSAALLAGRAFVTPDDVRGVAHSVLGHRLVLTPEMEGDPKARDGLIDEALQRIGYRRAVRPV
jgi:MoxR-like ATPase